VGVLDEAIRQHLELKRAHGASEDELQRQEAEALGPARREPGAGGEDEGAVAEASAGEGAATEARPEASERSSPPTAAPASEPPGDDFARAGRSETTDSEADEVPADEALEVVVQPDQPADVAERSGPARVFDVEELGPPDAQARGALADSAARPLREVPDLEDEKMLDAEEEAEEELADELAAGAELSGSSPDSLAQDSIALESAEPEASGAPTPATEGASTSPVSGAPTSPAADRASFEEDTVFRPPPLAETEAETDEYEVSEDMLEDRPASSGRSAVEGELVEEELLAEDELLEEEDALLEEDEDELEHEDDLDAEEELEEEEELEDELAEEAGPPAGRHVPADEDLDAEDDLEAEDDEDALEGRPELRHEAPEDEQLWSEQSPPRDFDLDR
jgi:hypothetical protein